MCYTGKCKFEISCGENVGDCNISRKEKENAGQCPEHMVELMEGPDDVCDICNSASAKLYGDRLVCDKCWKKYYWEGLENANNKSNY